MNVLGIETSCDETSIAILSNNILKINLIFSQHFHKEFGGVIPELSSRAHLQQIIPLMKKALNLSNSKLSDINLITATAGPGLIGALLVGLTFGKSLSLSLDRPFVPVNHIEGHIFSGFLMKDKPEYPFLCTVVSGGHTLLLIVKSEFEIIKLGSTIDDAIGEAFDKVSKILGLNYPGGPEIEKYSLKGDENSINFPVAKCKNKFDFSFSGLKTSVLRYFQKNFSDNNINESLKADISASFQKAAVISITQKINLALQEYSVKSISLVGGVAANQKLRNEFLKIGNLYNLKVVIPNLEYCGDNAAMIAFRGSQYFSAGKSFGLSTNAYPNLPFEIFD